MICIRIISCSADVSLDMANGAKRKAALKVSLWYACDRERQCCSISCVDLFREVHGRIGLKQPSYDLLCTAQGFTLTY